MNESVTVARIGTGTGEDPYRADVPEGTSWKQIEEHETEFVIEILQ
ncbi:hypothetical protein PN4B1_17050 [Paenibacillus naphthalenovorans]|nr:hypothetical protein [Paenibacillus naphthalenovorans]GCL71800.1 hypothetical protein PN4B1_17050 [Paenibacillus naphthalenovorans]